MIPRSWSGAVRIVVFMIPAVILAFAFGRQARPSTTTRDVIVSSEFERVIAFTGAVIHIASEAKIEKELVWRWRKEKRPDGTTIETTTAKRAEREEKREAKREARVENVEREARRDVAEERIRVVERADVFGAGLLLGYGDGVQRIGGYGHVRVLGPIHVGLWALDPHKEYRSGGVTVGVRW